MTFLTIKVIVIVIDEDGDAHKDISCLECCLKTPSMIYCTFL